MVTGQSVSVCVAYAVMIAANVLSNAGFFGGKDNKTISDSHPTWLTPDGATFAVWGIIYVLQLVLVVYQLRPSEHAETLLRSRCGLTGLDARWRIVFAFMCNAVWLTTFTNELYWVALIVMIEYLAFLVSLYTSLNVASCETVLEAFLLASGIATNLSWIVVAFSVLTLTCLGEAGFKDKDDVAGSAALGYLISFAVAALGCERAVRAGDVAYAFVAGWALRGIYRMQTVVENDCRGCRFPVAALDSSYGNFVQVLSFCAWLAAIFAIVRPYLQKMR